MTFVKFGSLYVNFDRVTHARDLRHPLPGGGLSPGVLRLEFDSGTRIDLVDARAAALAWLDGHLATAPTDPTGPTGPGGSEIPVL
jgi:hypothetical protein